MFVMATVVATEVIAFAMLVTAFAAVEVGSPFTMSGVGALMVTGGHSMSEEDGIVGIHFHFMARSVIDMSGILMDSFGSVSAMRRSVVMRSCCFSTAVEGEGHADGS